MAETEFAPALHTLPTEIFKRIISRLASSDRQALSGVNVALSNAFRT